MRPEKQTHALRRQRWRRAVMRRRRLTTIKRRSRDHILAAKRWTVQAFTPKDDAVRSDGSRLPTRQELQIEAKFHHAVQELGLA